MWHWALMVMTLLPINSPPSPPMYLQNAPARHRAPASPPSTPSDDQIIAGTLIVTSDTSRREGKRVIYEGYVDARMGSMRLQCDTFIFDEETEVAEAIGNVIFDLDGQRITGRRAVFDLRTRKGTIWDATGFTNRTPDGVTVYFRARRIERTGLNRFRIHDGWITSCQEPVPKWSFTAKTITVTLDRRVSARFPAFRIKNIPLLWLPFATVPIMKRVRTSGFLTPGFGNSNVRGASIRIPYYQTLGRSADVLPRLEIFTSRGIGFGADFRARTSQTSHLNTGFFAVFDRLFGQPGPDQGGTAFYLDAVQHFGKGFLLATDVNITSNLAFRQIFSDSFEQAISPEERTEIYVTNNFDGFSFNLLARSRDIFLPNEQVSIRHLPSFELASRPRKLWSRWPIYISFRSAIEGLSRGESTFRAPSIVQRMDARPEVTIRLPSLGGMTVTPRLSLRSTFYSNSVDPSDRTKVLGESITRTYLALTVDIRPPALERWFRHRDGSLWFKHLIEPSITYRRITGIGSDFARLLRFDEHDTIADTNELEFALTNRFFTRRERPEGGGSQPHEWLTLTLAQKYFFDPTFGGALVPGRRNQFFPINTLSGFSFGGTERRFSPLTVKARLRPLSSLFADLRLDYDTRQKSVRNISFTGGLHRHHLSLSQTWTITRAMKRPDGTNEAGTFAGNLYQSSVVLGNPDRGAFGGFDLVFDFTDRLIDGQFTSGRLVSSSIRFGYTFDCCSFQIQNTTFKIGLRNENRLTFSLTLFGIGSFGRHTSAGRRIFGR